MTDKICKSGHSQDSPLNKARYLQRKRMVRFVVHFRIEIYIQGVRLNPNCEVLLPTTTYLDLAGGNVRLTLEELVPTPVMTRRVVITDGTRRYIETPVWAVQRMEWCQHCKWRSVRWRALPETRGK